MKIAGIISEYNPFHNGHAFQIAQLRAMGVDAIVCVMSPSVVQRGTAARYPSEVRVRAALYGGADLVLSLQAPYATLSAEGFAKAGVSILNALGGVDTLAFGAETPDVAKLNHVAKLLLAPDFFETISSVSQSGVSFAKARAQAAELRMPGAGAVLTSPNNILAVEYCKAILQQNATIKPLALPRIGAGHDESLNHAQYASATALRTLAQQNGEDALAPYVPKQCLPIYQKAKQEGQVVSQQAFSLAVLSRLRMCNIEQFAQIRGMKEGLEHRLFAAVQTATTVQQLYDTIKTKRYTHARIRRMVLDASLGITNDIPEYPSYLQVLGTNETGLAVLKQSKPQRTLPLDTSLKKLQTMNEQTNKVVTAHVAAEDLISLCLEVPAPMGLAYQQEIVRVASIL